MGKPMSNLLATKKSGLILQSGAIDVSLIPYSVYGAPNGGIRKRGNFAMDYHQNQNVYTFVASLGDILRLPGETIAMTYMYMHRYRKFCLSNVESNVLDHHTLVLAALSLATKATEAPRRLRALLGPAFHLLHPREKLEIPSTKYDVLRRTIVRSEVLLLRILKFELRIALPLTFLPRYIGRMLDEMGGEGVEDYERMGRDRRAEYQVVTLMSTGLGQKCRSVALQSCQDYQLSTFWPPRAVAAGCVLLVAERMGIDIHVGGAELVDTIAGKKVDPTDIQEIRKDLERLITSPDNIH